MRRPEANDLWRFPPLSQTAFGIHVDFLSVKGGSFLKKKPLECVLSVYSNSETNESMPDGQHATANKHGKQPVHNIDAEELERLLFGEVLSHQGRENEAEAANYFPTKVPFENVGSSRVRTIISHECK